MGDSIINKRYQLGGFEADTVDELVTALVKNDVTGTLAEVCITVLSKGHVPVAEQIKGNELRALKDVALSARAKLTAFCECADVILNRGAGE